MEDKIKSIIGSYLGIKPETINYNMELMQDLGINSYDIMSIVASFEEEFDIKIDDRDIRQFINVGDVLNYIEQKAKAVSIEN